MMVALLSMVIYTFGVTYKAVAVRERESGTRRELPVKGDKKYDRLIRLAAHRDGVRSRAGT